MVACLVLLGACRPVPADPPESADPRSSLAAHRAALAGAAERLVAAEDLTGLEAFAAFLQQVADAAVARLGPEATAAAIARLMLDDLVDLALGPQAPWIQRLLMVSPPLWAGTPVRLERFGTNGFAAVFRAGDGGLRHVALTAAGSWVAPPLWVEAAARLWGRDLVPVPGTDSAADLAANARGRAFARWLRAADRATLSDGSSVAAWTRAAFGPTVR